MLIGWQTAKAYEWIRLHGECIAVKIDIPICWHFKGNAEALDSDTVVANGIRNTIVVSKAMLAHLMHKKQDQPTIWFMRNRNGTN